ncbi:uncharacterized protein PAC_01137 [Phialocephala subalpina]|uniref:Uncharacterized protein n=1 Tax=Phialocephala subalpina TaxID=576137 RepID=A0A1L7WEQ0_9HELO|nr:uncharacterized protein PAC_01137 [Phialocephala subalpina]
MSRLWISPSRGVCLRDALFRHASHHVKSGKKIICRTVYTTPPPGNRYRQLSVKVTDNRDTPDAEFWSDTPWHTLKPYKHAWEKYWKGTHQVGKYHPGLVILFTPSLLPWLNDDTFIPKILKKVSHISKAGLENDPPVVYDVMCACVDGIAPEEHYGTFHEQLATQGISFLHSPSFKIFGYVNSPMLKEKDDSDKSPSPTKPAAITFGKGHRRLDHVTVPLANTIFQNGKPSFFQHTRWDAKDGQYILRKKWDDKRWGSIFAFAGINKPLFSFLPARPVTPFRAIESGMGNIVRELRFDGGDVGPASRELETVVSEISESLGGTTVDIWALIAPNEVVSAVAENMPEHGPEYVGFWLDKGATICRVVSGGGGWGPKQGLLSLDPQTTYTTTEASSELSTERDVTSLGSLAQPGASIQFLAIDNDLPRPLAARKLPAIGERKSIVFGAIPSTIDEILKVSSEGQATKYNYRVGHFGCVSGSGIFYSRDRPNPVGKSKADAVSKSPEEPAANSNQAPPSLITHTKIDLPYSYIYMDGRVASQRKQDFEERTVLRSRMLIEEQKRLKERLNRFPKSRHILNKNQTVQQDQPKE